MVYTKTSQFSMNLCKSICCKHEKQCQGYIQRRTSDQAACCHLLVPHLNYDSALSPRTTCLHPEPEHVSWDWGQWEGLAQEAHGVTSWWGEGSNRLRMSALC